MSEGDQQQAQQQQAPSPTQRLERALAEIRKVQNLLEMSYPNQVEAIKLQRNAGDQVWQVIREMQQQQQGS